MLVAPAFGTRLIVTPDDPSWDDARQAWDLAVDQRPDAVAVPATPQDVVVAVQYARERGLRIAPQNTGHRAAPLAPQLDGALLVRTHRMRGVEIDPSARVARVEAGALWSDVSAAAARHGLAAVPGSSPGVGVVGSVLGGGIGWLGRRYGLASDRLLAAELVLPDGRRVRADGTGNTTLLRALRGGGGAFGVVTAMELELVEPGPLHAGLLVWDVARAREVLEAWRAWTRDLPDSVSTVFRVLRAAPVELEAPAPIRDRAFAMVEAVVLGDAAEADGALAPMRAVAGSELDTVGPTAPEHLQDLLMHRSQPVPAATGHALLAALPAGAAAALLGAMSQSSLLSSQLVLLGGALAGPTRDHGAAGPVEAAYALFGAGSASTPDRAAATWAGLRRLRAPLAPFVTGRQALDFAEDPATDPARLWHPEAARWLRGVKAGVDPHNLMVSDHPLPA